MTTQKIVFIKKRGVKHLRITIQSNGTCRVTVPFRIPIILAKRFVEERREWIAEKRRDIRERVEKQIQLAGIQPYQEVRAKALHFTTQEVENLNKFYGFSYKKISIRNQKTRWGSCSKRGALSFNYRILYLPKRLVEYLIVHELCHLKELHHGRAFWELVAKRIPDYLERRHELKMCSFR